MLRSLFGGRKRKPNSTAASVDTTIREARVGDVVVIHGLALEYDDCYFIIERLHRYGGNGMTWYELEIADAEYRIWLEWSYDRAGLFITATDDRRPVSLEAVGLTEDDLNQFEDLRSIDQGVEIDGLWYVYRNSFEAFYFQDNRPTNGEGFYMWEFLSEDDRRVLAIIKYTGEPYYVHFSEIIPPENVQVYPGERPDSRNRGR